MDPFEGQDAMRSALDHHGSLACFFLVLLHNQDLKHRLFQNGLQDEVDIYTGLTPFVAAHIRIGPGTDRAWRTVDRAHRHIYLNTYTSIQISGS